jgi:hypothetical protein
MPVVVGIFQNNDAVQKVVGSLKTAGLDPSDLTVISEDEASGQLISSGVQFVLSGEAEEATIAGGTGLITGSGPEVPGLGRVKTDVGETEAAPELEALSDLNVPDSRTDDYVEALEHGRAVAGMTTGDADKVKALFTAAGASTVEVF